MAMRRTLKRTLVGGARFASTSCPAAVPKLTYPETHVTTLCNGLRVVTESRVDSETASVGVYIDAGSRFETEKTNGVAHFLQRMTISSSKNNMINGHISREHTAYYVQGSDHSVPKALHILSDALQNSTFEETLINRERDLILHQIKQKETEQVMLDHLHAAAFQGCPLGRPILGPAENINKITKKDIQDYFSTHYAPHRMVISAYGPAVEHEDVVQQVKKLFTKLPLNPPITTTQLLEKQPALFTASDIRMRDDRSPLAHFAVAFKGASWTDPDFVVLMLMQAMLGSWNKTSKHNTGNLVRIGRLAESMMAFNTNYKDTGLLGVYAVAKPDCLEDLADAIIKEICFTLCHWVKDDDLIRAKNQLKSSLLLNTHGTSAAVAAFEDIGRQFITYGRRIPLAELFSKIDAVDVATFKRVAIRFTFDQVPYQLNMDIQVVASGPIKLLPDNHLLRSQTYLLHAYVVRNNYE